MSEGIDFLTEVFNTGKGYSAMNTARCALSSIICSDQSTFGKHPIVIRFMKGAFELRPSFPRYIETWDVTGVLKYLQKQHPVSKLSLKELTMKVVSLLAILSGQRCQTLKALNITNVLLSDDKCVFYIVELLKTSKPGKHFGRLELLAYKPDDSLCIVKCVKSYLEKTDKIRGAHQQFFVSYNKPHAPVTSDTIGRWIKNVLDECGIDIKTFSAHSTRSASTSAAKFKQIPIEDILSAGGWTKETTFSKYYNKPIIGIDNFSSKLLHAMVD